jgi:peptidoglycan hydrolase CwlO-like protein
MDSLLFEMAKYSWVVALMLLMFLIILFLVYKINNNNIDKIKTELMISINAIKVDMMDNANRIEVGVDKDVVILKQDQVHLSNQLKKVEDNIHSLGNKMQDFSNRISHMDKTMDRVNNTLTLMSIQMGGDLKQAIKGSIDNLDD